jgi:ERCC4-type nuclease
MKRLEACLLLESLPGMGWHRSQKMVTHFGSPEGIFQANIKDWNDVEGLGAKVCKELNRWKERFPAAEKRAQQIEALGIECLFFWYSRVSFSIIVLCRCPFSIIL